jgi:betaine-aldehyde dehydrogenase
VGPLPLRSPDRLFVGGKWTAPRSGRQLEVIRPDTEESVFHVAEADESDIHDAVTAAYGAFQYGTWARAHPSERAEVLLRMAELLRARAADLALVWASEVGVLHSAAAVSTEAVGGTFRYYGKTGAEMTSVERRKPRSGSREAALAREPIGVVGVIVPWNNAGAILANKVAPALLAGCTVVVKSSPEAPGEALIMAEAAEEAGLPAGVLNVVTADRAASQALVTDGRVDKVAFTGSTAVGRHIYAVCSDRVARVTLELGGKSAAIVLDDFDVDTAAAALADSTTFLSGQVCAAITRIIVSARRHDAFAEALAAQLSSVKIGSQFDPGTQMGPVVSARQRSRVESYVRAGVDEGATLVTGGHRPPDLETGFFFQPTVFGNVDNDSTIASEEIFGPVVCVIPAVDEEAAVALANDSIYGLNAAVFTQDVDRALTVARSLRCGTVSHNSVRADYSIGFGGFKQSGIGREGGLPGLDAFLESKTILLDGEPTDWERN